MSTDHGPRPGQHRVRASDDEREQIATILRAAMTEGRLSLQEGEERLAAAYAATYRDELGPLTADLPDGGRRALYETPEFKRYARRLLRRRGGIAALVVAAVVALSLLNGHFFWPVIPLVFLAVVFLKHHRHHRYGHWRRDWRAYH